MILKQLYSKVDDYNECKMWCVKLVAKRKKHLNVPKHKTIYLLNVFLSHPLCPVGPSYLLIFFKIHY